MASILWMGSMWRPGIVIPLLFSVNIPLLHSDPKIVFITEFRISFLQWEYSKSPITSIATPNCHISYIYRHDLGLCFWYRGTYHENVDFVPMGRKNRHWLGTYDVTFNHNDQKIKICHMSTSSGWNGFVINQPELSQNFKWKCIIILGHTV